MNLLYLTLPSDVDFGLWTVTPPIPAPALPSVKRARTDPKSISYVQ